MALDTTDYSLGAPYLQEENNDPIRNYESVLFDLGKEDKEIIEEKVYQLETKIKKYKENLKKYFEIKEALSQFGNYTSDQAVELRELEKLLKK